MFRMIISLYPINRFSIFFFCVSFFASWFTKMIVHPFHTYSVIGLCFFFYSSMIFDFIIRFIFRGLMEAEKTNADSDEKVLIFVSPNIAVVSA